MEIWTTYDPSRYASRAELAKIFHYSVPSIAKKLEGLPPVAKTPTAGHYPSYTRHIYDIKEAEKIMLAKTPVEPDEDMMWTEEMATLIKENCPHVAAFPTSNFAFLATLFEVDRERIGVRKYYHRADIEWIIEIVKNNLKETE